MWLTHFALQKDLKMKTILKFMTLALLIGFVSCKKDKKDPEPEPEPTPVATTNTIKILFEHNVDTIPLVLNQNYRSPNLDTFKVSILKYYISNVVITKNDNSTFVEPNSYHLIDASNLSSTSISIPGLPFTSYKGLSFTLGVDSARNCSGAQDGDLAQNKGMFWTWSSGYIMFKLEGSSPQSGASNKSLTYHIGGFGGVNKVQRNFSFNFASTPANVSASVSPIIHLSVDVNEFFKNPAAINFATQHTQMSTGATAKMYADNYADMIEFEHVHN